MEIAFFQLRVWLLIKFTGNSAVDASSIPGSSQLWKKRGIGQEMQNSVVYD